MVTRVCALWLAVLTALPFTAPFATLDLSDFVRGRRVYNVLATVAAPAAVTAQDDADDAIPSAACFQRIDPLGLSALLPVASPVYGDGLTRATGTFTPVAPAPSSLDTSALAAILRL